LIYNKKKEKMKHVKLFENFTSTKKYIYSGYLDGLFQIGIVSEEQARYLANNLPPNTGNSIDPYSGQVDSIVLYDNGVRTEPEDILGVSDFGDEVGEIYQKFEIPVGAILALANTGHEADPIEMSVEEYVKHFKDNYTGDTEGGRYNFR
jgi:hypothetical protein